MTAAGRNVAAIHALTPTQEGILYHVLRAPGSGLYHEQYVCHLNGHLDEKALREAWDWVTARHDVLRSLFTWERRERPLQVVRETVSLPWTYEDWQAEADSGSAGEASPPRTQAGAGHRFQARCRERIEADRDQSFRLEAAPLFRITLARLDDDLHWMMWSFHHLLLDGWSMRCVLREVFDAYETIRQGRSPSAPPALPFREYTRWLQSRDVSADESFWRRELSGFESPSMVLGVAATRQSARSQGNADYELWLSPEETAALTALAQTRHLTLNTLLRGAWGWLLASSSEASDVVFGATVSGRPPDLPGIERRIGLFINTIPVRIPVEETKPVSEWLAGLQARQLDASVHEYAPLVEVQKWSEVRGAPLFQSLLVVQNVPLDEDPDTARSLEITDERYLERSNFPLALLAFPSDRLLVRFVFDSGQFDLASVERLAGQFRRVLAGFTERPDAPLSAIELASPAEMEEALVAWNSHQAPEPAAVGFLSVPQQIATMAETTPAAVAVRFEEREITYGELLDAADNVATHLLRLGVKTNTCVAIALDRSLEMVVGIVAILRAGGAYVPIDPEQPSERVRFILEDAQVGIILTRPPFAASLESTGKAVLSLDERGLASSTPGSTGIGAATPTAATAALGTASHGDLAYVIYTSGSTGTPRGVQVTHGNLVYSTFSRWHHYPESVGRYCLLSPFVFDSSVAGLFWTLTQGGTLVLPRARAELDVTAVAQLIREQRVTHLLALPALYGLLLEHAAPADLSSLRIAIVAGEACPPEVARLHHDTVPEASLHNEYGPTEATVWSTVYRVPAAIPARLPIGRPIAHMNAYVLDQKRSPVAPGLPGELALSGPGVTPGYLNDEERTIERFPRIEIPGVGMVRVYLTGDRARWRADGQLEFLGRLDHQVKIRGHRIELGEIASALRGHPGVRDAAVVVDTTESGHSIESLLGRLERLDPAVAQELLTRVEAIDADEADELLKHEI